MPSRPSDLRGRVLALLQSPDYQPLDKVGISKALRWPAEQRATLRQILKELETEGEIALIRKDRYVIPATADLLTGTLQVHMNGNAHLLSGVRDQPDIFIPSAATATARHGDKVIVRRMHEGHKQPATGGRIEGRVIRILQRASETMVGTLQQTKKTFLVVPDDARFPQNVIVRPGETRLPQPPLVGDKVVVRLDPWDNRHTAPEGEIIEVLGAATAQGVDMMSIIRKHNLPTEFPDTVEQEAARIPEAAEPEELARREDLRAQAIITIDPDDARDFDDAILVERTDRGWRLGVHIADVSHYVRPGSVLDKEARKRGNSTYLADRVLPMLPERLSNGICSLKPGVDRLVFSAFMEFSREGKMLSARFGRSVIRSTARLTYRQAFALLEGRKPVATPVYGRGRDGELAKPAVLDFDPAVGERVRVAWELATVLRRKRFEHGSLELDFPEVKVWLDDQGRAARLEKVENDASHQLIEECMLAANEAVATELKNRLVPSIYRIHEDPDPDRLNEFREFAATYGFRSGDLSQRREVQKLLRSIRGKAEEYAIKLQFLKSLKRATYNPNPVGHYGLAKVNYTHFTSPIRRYADLVVHRSLADLLSASAPKRSAGRKPQSGTVAELADTSEHISLTERVSADAERDSTMLKKMEFFQRQLATKKPEKFRAVVVDVRSYGLLIELPDVLITGLIHVSTLPDDFYLFDPARLTFTGRKTRRTFKLGDELPVIVSRVDPYKRQLDFIPAGLEPAPDALARPRRR